MTIRIIELSGSAQAMGAAHGLRFGEDIRQYAEDRIGLVMSGLWSGNRLARADVLAIAESCLPFHEAFSPELTEEMAAMGEAAGLSPAEMVVAGGFTDFVDAVRANTGGPMPPEVFEDDCTAFIVPDERANGAGYFGQTWDMHDTATPFVILTDIRPSGRPRALVFTTTGCVGQIGMNEEGVAVGINNLTGADGRPGVTWPHVVRKALEQTSARDAMDVIAGAHLAGAHSYFVFDADGVGFNLEAMPTATAVFESTPGDVLVHTNHTLSPVASEREVPRPAQLQASSEKRLAKATELLAEGDIDEQMLMAVTRDEEAICQVGYDPYHVESCGAAIMRPRTRDFWAVWGLPKDNEYESFSLATS